MDYFDFENFKGMTFTKIEIGEYEGNDAIFFHSTDGTQYVMTHRQDCCENVWLEDVVGDFADIINQEVKFAYVNKQTADSGDISRTYTFYTLSTFQGTVTLRWNGESNGFYSESCDLYKITKGS